MLVEFLTDCHGVVSLAIFFSKVSYRCLERGHVAMETMGSWGREGLKFIKDLGSRIAEESGEKRSTSFLFQSMGIANMRGNAMSVLGTVPNSNKLDEIYYL